METLIVQAPYLGALLIAFGIFVRYLMFDRKRSSEIAESCHAAHAKSDELMAALVNRTNSTIDKCTESFGENTAMLGQVNQTLVKLNNR